MEFTLNQDQKLLEEAARRFFEDKHPLAQARRLPNICDPAIVALWREAQDMGFLSLLTPSQQGGMGLGLVDAWLVQEAAGRSLFSLPLAEAMLLWPAIQACTDAPGLVRELAQTAQAGQAPVHLALRTELVAGAFVDGLDGTAELNFFVPAQHGVPSSLVQWRSADATPLQGVEPSRRRLQLRGAASNRIELPQLDFARLQARLKLLRAAESVGAAFRALEITASFAGERVQFGKPIGIHQGLKHKLADTWMALDNARLAGLYAASAIEGGDAELDFPLAAVLACAAEATQAAVAQAIQFHGALGFSWEHDAHLFFKRVMHINAAQGPVDLLFEQVWASRPARAVA